MARCAALACIAKNLRLLFQQRGERVVLVQLCIALDSSVSCGEEHRIVEVLVYRRLIAALSSLGTDVDLLPDECRDRVLLSGQPGGR